MTEQQRPDEDVEGHRRHFFRGREGTESAESTEEEVEGHARARLSDEGLEDDVEGHRRRFHQDPEGTEDDDVEGHSPARRPL